MKGLVLVLRGVRWVWVGFDSYFAATYMEIHFEMPFGGLGEP